MVFIDIAAMFGIAGGWTTERLLRDDWSARRVARAVPIGIAVGLAVAIAATTVLFVTTKTDVSLPAIVGAFTGPVASAVWVRRWAPKSLPKNDLRSP